MRKNNKEIKVRDPITGAEKGVKLARFDLIPAQALYDLAEQYGKGAEKYTDHNYRKGYNWSQSYAALQRHLTQFWGGEDVDEETGTRHLISAAWHCLTLATFMDEYTEGDDRYRKL